MRIWIGVVRGTGEKPSRCSAQGWVVSSGVTVGRGGSLLFGSRHTCPCTLLGCFDFLVLSQIGLPSMCLKPCALNRGFRAPPG